MTREPVGDRPAAWDITGDVWQRQGPPGTATWFCATDQAANPILSGGRTWTELDDSILGPMIAQPRPLQAPPPYTDSIPILVDAVTDPITVTT